MNRDEKTIYSRKSNSRIYFSHLLLKRPCLTFSELFFINLKVFLKHSWSISSVNLRSLEKKQCYWQRGYKKAKMVRTSGEYLNNGAVLWVFVNVADTFIQSPADYASIYHQQRQTRIHSLLQTQARESKHQTATLELFVFAGLKQLSYPSIWFEFGDYFTTHCSVYCNRIKTFKYDRRNCVILCAASNKRHTHTHMLKKKSAATVQRMKTGFSPTKSWWDCMLWP